jgi:hypothetical protein
MLLLRKIAGQKVREQVDRDIGAMMLVKLLSGREQSVERFCPIVRVRKQRRPIPCGIGATRLQSLSFERLPP